MRYLTLFRLEILHAYHADQRCLDFQIEPTTLTQKLLKDYRCVLKQFPNGLQVLISVNRDNTPFIALPKDLFFAFHLRLLNSEFSLFTDLTEFSQLAAPLFTNESPATQGELIPVSREAWDTEQFIVQSPSTKEVFALAGRPLEDPGGEVFIVKGLGEKSGRGRYDASARTVAVNSSQASPGTLFTVTYPIAPRLERGIFADVEIKYSLGKASLLEKDNSFQITFSPRKARWKYYVVTDKSNGKTAIPSLEDKDKAVLFKAEDRTDLTRTPDPADQIAVKLAQQYPDRQYFRFVSSEPIPCQQAARKNIQFYLNGDKVISSLPNPSLQNYCIDVRNAVREHTLFQIIPYFTQ